MLVKFMVKFLINEICHTYERNEQPIIFLSLALDTWIELTIQVPISSSVELWHISQQALSSNYQNVAPI